MYITYILKHLIYLYYEVYYYVLYNTKSVYNILHYKERVHLAFYFAFLKNVSIHI